MIIMNLLNYTKKISEKVKFYDEIAKNPFLGMKNPFAEPITLTVIWIEEDKK